ncbi:MAG TPA: YHYH protein [Phycisphaerae bacterium]|nr:YHYH protein [Phycisphaerae bacterium]
MNRRNFCLSMLGLAAGGALLRTRTFAIATAPATQTATPFRSNVKVELTPDFIIVHSDGIPDHTTGTFPNPNNPNRILKQNYTFKIPRHPVKADHITKLPMGPIGVAINGIPFYNPYTAEGTDASKTEIFDECCGHPDPLGRYHYHIYPKCIHTSFFDKPGEHSPLIGYAFDGFAIYGPNSEQGKPPTDLDQCNGHTDSTRGYHYHVTATFPYILGGYRGVVEMSNLDSNRPGGRGRDPLGRDVGPIEPARNGRGPGPRGGRGGRGDRFGPPPFPPPGPPQ